MLVGWPYKKDGTSVHGPELGLCVLVLLVVVRVVVVTMPVRQKEDMMVIFDKMINSFGCLFSEINLPRTTNHLAYELNSGQCENV